ncbi:MAG: quinoprotein dehydrogenase-associated SoxYZ-like carrier [Gammaproteobacteria bacterium]
MAPVLLLSLVSLASLADVAPADYRQQLSDKVWEENLKPANFPDTQITEGSEQNILEIKAPYSAEDATIVPVSIHTKVEQQPGNYVKKLHVFVDKNPVPLVGIFEFTPASGRADLAMRIRVDDFSYVRAIAEMNNGELYMVKTFVRAKGACSAPPPASMEDSRKLLGTMKMNTIGDVVLGKPNLMQLMIRHPNITGMAPLKVGSRIIPPAHFINTLEVGFNDQLIMKAQLTFSVSMDPAFRFYFVPDKAGTITVKGTDTEKNHFSSSHDITTS